jgi:cation transport ATPase
VTDQPQQPFTSNEISDEEEAHAARLANRFDIRRIIGGLFVIYGVVLTLMGIFGSSHVKNKADGVNINLWTGLALIAFAVFMIGWALLRPVEPEPPETRGKGSGRIRRAPAT